jgi:hypothetical protein
VPPRVTRIAPEHVLESGPGGRCHHCLGTVYRVCVKGEDGAERWVPAELVGDHFELHDCTPKAWHASPVTSKVLG